MMQGGAVPRYGPIGNVGVAGLTRGAIRNGTWLIPGVTSPHTLSLRAGSLGRGPMTATIDGIPVLTFPKPNRSQPVVVSPQGIVDGYPIVVYAESRDNGNLVTADVFVSGFSLLTGAPLATVPDQATAASGASATNARIGALVQASNMIWILPVIAGYQSIANLARNAGPNPAVPVPLVVVGLLVAFFVIGGAGWWVLTNIGKRPSLSRRSAIAASVTVFVVAFIATMACIAVGFALTR